MHGGDFLAQCFQLAAPVLAIEASPHRCLAGPAGAALFRDDHGAVNDLMQAGDSVSSVLLLTAKLLCLDNNDAITADAPVAPLQ